MNRLIKAAIASTAVAATALIPMTQSFAGPRYHERGFYGHHMKRHGHYTPRHYSRRPVVVYRDHHHGDALAAGVLGLAVGALIAGAATAPAAEPYPVYPAPSPEYYPAPPASYQNQASYNGGVEPWTDAWYRYCEQRFRSFDPSSGTYMGYDGKRHFCTVK